MIIVRLEFDPARVALSTIKAECTNLVLFLCEMCELSLSLGLIYHGEVVSLDLVLLKVLDDGEEASFVIRSVHREETSLGTGEGWNLDIHVSDCITDSSLTGPGLQLLIVVRAEEDSTFFKIANHSYGYIFVHNFFHCYLEIVCSGLKTLLIMAVLMASQGASILVIDRDSKQIVLEEAVRAQVLQHVPNSGLLRSALLVTTSDRQQLGSLFGVRSSLVDALLVQVTSPELIDILVLIGELEGRLCDVDLLLTRLVLDEKTGRVLLAFTNLSSELSSSLMLVIGVVETLDLSARSTSNESHKHVIRSSRCVSDTLRLHSRIVQRRLVVVRVGIDSVTKHLSADGHSHIAIRTSRTVVRTTVL